MALLPLGLAGSGSQEEGARLTWTGGHTTGEGERERNITPGHTCLLLTERRESERPKEAQLLALKGLGLNVVLPSPSSAVTVVIDGYTHNSILTSGDSVPLGTQIILVCQVVGLPYGTPLSYTWTCQNRYQCASKHDRTIHNEHILAVNTTSSSDGGTYTCQVTATGGQEATGSFEFTLTVTGMCVCLVLYCSSNGTGTSLVLRTHSGGHVVHSDHRIIPHQFLITSKHKISYLRVTQQQTFYRITCTVSSGPPPPRFYSPNGTLDTGAVTQQTDHSETLQWDDFNIETLQNRDMYCGDSDTNYFYSYFTSSDTSE